MERFIGNIMMNDAECSTNMIRFLYHFYFSEKDKRMYKIECKGDQIILTSNWGDTTFYYKVIKGKIYREWIDGDK